MTVDAEGIALCLGSSVEVVTFPFDAAKRSKMTVRTLVLRTRRAGGCLRICPVCNGG